MPTESQAVNLLSDLGLTEYEARCFVALSRVEGATASEISELSGVPRSRVYDAVERLHRRGLVDVQQSDPREYRAISTDAALETLREGYDATLESADEALSKLRRADTSELEEEGAWAIAEHDHVTDRLLAFVEDAADEIYVLVADGTVFDGDLSGRLAAVAGGDVRVIVETATDDDAAAIGSSIPDAEVQQSALAADPAELEGKRLGRIVMVDRRSVLISAVAEGPRPGQAEETAIWASGPDHGLVVGLRHVLGARIDDSEALVGE